MAKCTGAKDGGSCRENNPGPHSQRSWCSWCLEQTAKDCERERERRDKPEAFNVMGLAPLRASVLFDGTQESITEQIAELRGDAEALARLQRMVGMAPRGTCAVLHSIADTLEAELRKRTPSCRSPHCPRHAPVCTCGGTNPCELHERKP